MHPAPDNEGRVPFPHQSAVRVILQPRYAYGVAVTVPKIIESAHYHLWTDALHARALAKQAQNRWDCGTYVRWSITTAWTVLEMACEDAVKPRRTSRRFKEKLDAACEERGLTALDWGAGVWQQVLHLQSARNDFLHINATQANLFPPATDADNALGVVRRAISDIFFRAAKGVPPWLCDDDDRGWDSGPGVTAHATAVHAGADPDGADTVRIVYEHKGREYDSALLPSGTDHGPYIESLIQGLCLPVTAIRVYKGKELVYERKVEMRGA